MALTPLHRAAIRLAAASGPGTTQQDLLMLVQARSKAKTPDGAQNLYDTYKRDHPGTKLGPKDFYDKGKGKETVDTTDNGWDRRFEEKKEEKAQSKSEKGEKSTKKDQAKAEAKTHEAVNRGRDKAREKLKGLGPADLKKEVDKIMQSMGKDSLEAALSTATHRTQSYLRNTGGFEYGSDKEKRLGKATEAAYQQGILSKYQKNTEGTGAKAEKGKAKQKVNDAAAKAGLEEADVTAIKSFAKDRKKKLDDKSIAKLEDKEWADYYRYRWDQLSSDEYKKWKDIEYGPGGGTPKTKAQLQAEAKKDFLANADPETKKRVQKMSPVEFEAMMAAIMDDEEAGGGKTGALRTAAIRLASSLPTGDPLRAAMLELLVVG